MSTNPLMKRVMIGALTVCAWLPVTPALAAPTQCTVVSQLPNNLLYKPSNFHGGRGPSWLFGCQVKNLWPAGSTLKIYGENGNVLRYKFKMWDPGHYTFGRRYYVGVGSSSAELRRQALAAGGSAIYIQGKGNLCYKINNPLLRQGNLQAVPGRGRC
jgi:hypothetical protein